MAGSCLPVSCGNKAVVAAEDDCPVSEADVSRWAEWTPWSECSVSCGSGGVQQRKRECFDPLGLNKCQGPTEEQRNCQPSPEPCESQWGTWSPCDAVCGEGIQRRRRACLSSDCVGEEKNICRTVSERPFAQYSSHRKGVGLRGRSGPAVLPIVEEGTDDGTERVRRQTVADNPSSSNRAMTTHVKRMPGAIGCLVL